MVIVLLAGVMLNSVGATRFFASAISDLRGGVDAPGDYVQIKLFTAGTAAIFASFYAYLYFEPKYVVPFLAFGATLKTWAFIISLGLFVNGRLARRDFIEFGVCNLIVGALFWAYFINQAI